MAAPAHGLASSDRVFTHVAVGVDFTAASLTAARWATTWVAPRADLLLAHVASPHEVEDLEGQEAPSPGPIAPEMLSALSGGLHGFGATLDAADVQTVLHIGAPSRWLTVAAESSGATLLVVGRRADSARRRVGEPNVLERVTRRTSASVLVVPEGTTRRPDHVIAAVDESEFAEHAIRMATAIAAQQNIPMVVLHILAPVSGEYGRVIERPRQPRRPGGTLRAAGIPQHASVSTRTARWWERFAALRAPIGIDRVEIGVGDPARQIVSSSSELGSSLIVVGKRGADGAPAGSLGSVARTLLTKSPLPVLAVGE